MKIDKDKFKVYSWKNWMSIFWIINPGSVINELVLGQRVPKISLLDKTSPEPRFKRTYYPCPYCNTLHDSRKWDSSLPTVYKNWFGLYCDSCGGVIPCIWSGFSFLLLAITFPIWGWYRKRLKTSWLEKQAARYENLDYEKTESEFSGKRWWLSGMIWGLIMFVFMGIVLPFFLNDSLLKTTSMLLLLLLWLAGGAVFGYSMKLFTDKKGSQASV